MGALQKTESIGSTAPTFCFTTTYLRTRTSMQACKTPTTQCARSGPAPCPPSTCAPLLCQTGSITNYPRKSQGAQSTIINSTIRNCTASILNDPGCHHCYCPDCQSRTATGTSTTGTGTGTVTTPVPLARRYGQCGGHGWTGPTQCESTYKCVVIAEYWYSKCL
jgi:hypothetical protein